MGLPSGFFGVTKMMILSSWFLNSGYLVRNSRMPWRIRIRISYQQEFSIVSKYLSDSWFDKRFNRMLIDVGCFVLKFLNNHCWQIINQLCRCAGYTLKRCICTSQSKIEVVPTVRAALYTAEHQNQKKTAELCGLVVPVSNWLRNGLDERCCGISCMLRMVTVGVA